MGVQGYYANRLLPEQHNPREVAFASRWSLENDFGGGVRFIIGQLIPDCTSRDERVAATVIQWLGSNVGMSFLHEVIKASPEVAQGLRVPAESERDALRAENERLRRVIDEIAPMIPCHKCPGGWGVDRPTDPCPPDGETCAERVINEVSEWAISEAGKGEHETH